VKKVQIGRLANWSVVCRPKDQGGLGIKDLEVYSPSWEMTLHIGFGKHFLDENMPA
jgi:hypothetical protein